MPMRFQYTKRLKPIARKLRKQQTDAEKLLWFKLRNRQMAGCKFRRQFPLGKYIIDFYCSDNKLAIELDGSQHLTLNAKKYDESRTNYLRDQGITVLRFWDNEVFQNTNGVLESISSQLQTSPPPATPCLAWRAG